MQSPVTGSSAGLTSPAFAVAAGLLAAHGWSPDAATVHAAAAMMEQRARRTGELRAALQQLAAANDAAACLPFAAAAMTVTAMARLKALHERPGNDGCSPMLAPSSMPKATAFQIGLDPDRLLQCCIDGPRPSSSSSTGGDLQHGPSMVRPKAVAAVASGLSTLYRGGRDDGRSPSNTSSLLPRVV